VLAVNDLTAAANEAGVDTFRYFEAFVLAAIFYAIAAQIIQVFWRFVGARMFPAYAH
jgi:ABC-type amino acid transport system permease subunit